MTPILQKLFLVASIAQLIVACDLSSMDKKFYWDNGKLKKEGRVTNGKAEGLWTYYYESGERQSETNFKSDVRHGHTVHYWPNGQKKGEGDYVEGDLNGEWTAWYENGQKEREGRLERGKENGPWRLWDVQGHLTGEYEYVNGQKDGWTTLLDSAGAREQQYYVKGEMMGYTRLTSEGSVSESKIPLGPDTLPTFDKKYIKLFTSDSLLKAHVDYPFELHIPGVPYLGTAIAVTKGRVRKGSWPQFILTPDGKGETCIYLSVHMANGKITNGYGPACYGVTSE